MTTYILILFFHVGALGDGNSNATTTVPGFAIQQECIDAGKQAKALTNGTVKMADFVCVKQTVLPTK